MFPAKLRGSSQVTLGSEPLTSKSGNGWEIVSEETPMDASVHTALPGRAEVAGGLARVVVGERAGNISRRVGGVDVRDGEDQEHGYTRKA